MAQRVRRSTTGLEVLPRQHGFETPFDSWQIIGWVSALYLFASYYFLLGPLIMPFSAAIAVSTVVGVLGFAVFLLKITVSLSTNEDPEICGPQLSASILLGRTRPADKSPCQYCCRWVHPTSKHCATCDKCVIGFDHHCRWLNTCIGERNYPMFIAFVSCVLLAYIVIDAVSIFTLVQSGINWPAYESRLRQMYGGVASRPAYLFFVSVSFVYQLAGTTVIAHLLGFHLRLIYYKQTTYAYLQAQSARKRERERKKAEAASLPTAVPSPPVGCCVVTKRRNFKGEKRIDPAEMAAVGASNGTPLSGSPNMQRPPDRAPFS